MSELEVITHNMRAKATLIKEPLPTSAPVVAKVEIKPQKRLTISIIDHNAPDYIFEGEWAGRDIMVISRTIVRAYRKEQLQKRHANVNLKPIGASDGK